MKFLLITLAIGLAASDKLDRTYLPPPGAQFSGGVLGNNDAPLEPPYHTHSGPGVVVGHEGLQSNFGINGEPVNFGDKILQVPTTTTSIAFSQTTSFPAEGFEITGSPINPVTGLPIQLEQGNFPYGPSQGQQNVQSQTPNYGSKIEPGFAPQGPTSAPINNGGLSYIQGNQPLSQYPGQNMITPGGATQIPGSAYPGQNQGQFQYPGGQGNVEQQGFLPTGAPDNQRLDQYPGQNSLNNGNIVQIPAGNQGLAQYPGGQMVSGLVQYPGGQTIPGQQGFVTSNRTPINPQSGDNQYGVNYDGSQGPVTQRTYTGQPIDIRNQGGTQPTQISYQNQEPLTVGGIPLQFPTGNQNYGPFENVYQSGSSPSTYYDGVSSTTPLPGVRSSTSAYSSAGPVYRSERPQAASDRNAVILNYENVRTPNGYSYSFDTSNGIHADESGIVDNGTKAQGSYSYIGDDGKVYSVIYTADENGFQPRGDHLPTPPPIPEAIKRVIEQAARDKEAGIVHDGSYDEARYGDKKYKGTANHRRPQNHYTEQFGNKQFNGAKNDLIKPITGIKDVDYDEDIAQDQFNNNLLVTGIRKGSNEKIPPTRLLNQTNGEKNVQEVTEGTRGVLEDGVSITGDIDKNGSPIIEKGINQLNNYGTKKQGSSERRLMPNGVDLPFIGTEDTNQNNQPASKIPGFSGRHPMSGSVKPITKTKVTGSDIDNGAGDYSDTEKDGFDNSDGQDIDSSNSNISNGLAKNMNTNFNSVTGAPIVENEKQILRQRGKGNQEPSSTGNMYTQNKNTRPQVESSTQESTKSPSFSDYLKNTANQPISNQLTNQRDENGYQYQQPNNKFEQNTFPTRFSSQLSSTMKPDQHRNEYVEGTTRKPFMTPNVYYQNGKIGQSTPNAYNQNNRDSQSTSRKPFVAIGVTSPSDNSYSDYDDGDDYPTDQDIGKDRISSTKNPAEKTGITSRPNQSIQKTSRPQYIPGDQRKRVNQKDIVTPGDRSQNSRVVSSGPLHNSRFGSNENPLGMKPQQRIPSTIIPDSTTAIGRPVSTQSPSGTRQSNYKYQTTGPDSKYSDSNVGSGFPTTGSFPGLDSTTATPDVSFPQDYYTSTYGPIKGYSSTTTVPPLYGYPQGSGTKIPSRLPGLSQPSQDESFHTGYHYGPPKSGSLNPNRSGFFTSTGNFGVSPNSPTEIYQTTYGQGPGNFLSTTSVPTTTGRLGTFNPSQAGTFAPGNSPTGTNQGNYQNLPSTPDYMTTILSPTQGGKPVFGFPGSPGAQHETTRYEYDPSRPTFSTTGSPSTIGTTPGSYVPSVTNGPPQGYSTTYRLDDQTAKDTFLARPVDGFGRPVAIEQGGLHSGFNHPTPGTAGPVINIGPNIGGTEQSTTYPGSYDQPRVIGEDFSGPKQLQRYDPKTGYHYK